METITLLLILLKSIAFKIMLSPFKLIVWALRLVRSILAIIANTIEFFSNQVLEELDKNYIDDKNEKSKKVG